MNNIKNILVSLSLSVIATGLSFIICEAFVRILYPEIVPSTKYDWRSRHEEYPLEKDAGKFRIVVLGDSFTFGQGVKKEETFPKKLEMILNNSAEEPVFEVINLGFCGVNTVTELEILGRKGINPVTWQPDERYNGLAYKPDVVLLEFTLNDAMEAGRALQFIKRMDDRRRLGVIKFNSGPYALPLPETVDEFLTANSRFYLFFLGRYNQIVASLGLREGGEALIKSTIKLYDDDAKGWNYARQALITIEALCRNNSLPLVLVIYPVMFELNDYPYKELHEKIKTTAGQLGLKYVLDLYPAFQGMDGEALIVSPIDRHPNARAQDIASKAISQYLKKEGLVH